MIFSILSIHPPLRLRPESDCQCVLLPKCHSFLHISCRSLSFCYLTLLQFLPTVFTTISLYVIFSTLPTALLILAVSHPPFTLHAHSRKIFSFLEYVVSLSHSYYIYRFMLLSLYTLQSAVDARSHVFIRALNYY
jgi:hypothetical protein